MIQHSCDEQEGMAVSHVCWPYIADKMQLSWLSNRLFSLVSSIQSAMARRLRPEWLL